MIGCTKKNVTKQKEKKQQQQQQNEGITEGKSFHNI